MPSAEWVNLSAACAKVVAVDCAALLRSASTSVRARMAERVAAVDSAPPATECRRALKLADKRAQLEFQQTPGCRERYLVQDAAVPQKVLCFQQSSPLQPLPAAACGTVQTPSVTPMNTIYAGNLAPRREVMVKVGRGIAKICRIRLQIFDLPISRPITPRRSPNYPDASRETAWPGIPNSRTSCTARARQDAQQSKLFCKLAREITVAAKMGTPDPSMNARLRSADHRRRGRRTCRSDNIERAIKKAIGSDAENYDEIRYEGYGPGGVAVIVEALTDNRNRAASDIRSYFTKSGGNLGETGSVSLHVRPCRRDRV